jgi:hypothetical protein
LSCLCFSKPAIFSFLVFGNFLSPTNF